MHKDAGLGTHLALTDTRCGVVVDILMNAHVRYVSRVHYGATFGHARMVAHAQQQEDADV